VMKHAEGKRISRKIGHQWQSEQSKRKGQLDAPTPVVQKHLKEKRMLSVRSERMSKRSFPLGPRKLRKKGYGHVAGRQLIELDSSSSLHLQRKTKE